LVDAKNIYQTIYDIKELEAFFGNDDEAIEALRNFRTVLSEKDKTELLRKFLKIWQATGDVYQAFKTHLTEKKLAYEGMLYRELVDLFETKKDKLVDQFDNIYFCGFNALSNAEEKMLDILFKQERGVAFWDSDPIYMENPWHEANMFLKKYEQKWDTIRSYWFREDMLSTPKKIKIIGTVQNVLQTKIAAQLITDEVEKTQATLNNTVLVLADENLLMPTLYSLPEEIKSANVTMGYPAVQSPLYNLIEQLFDLQITRRGVGKNAQYNSGQILKFFNNSYIHTLSEENYPDYIYWLSINRRTFLKLENIENIVKEDKIKSAFISQKTSKDFLSFLIAFLKEIFDYFYDDEQDDDKEEDSQKTKHQQEKDSIYHFIINIQQLEKRLDDNLHKISITLLKKLTMDYLRLVKIPFTGDIESGIQIMGFLETRTLDFENVFILSVNEGQLPSERKLNSFIPYSVRKAFKMPTFEEQDAIYCYHFYRLLQRAKNVYLIYDTEVK